MKTYEKGWWWQRKARGSGESNVSLLSEDINLADFDPERIHSFDHTKSRKGESWFSFLRLSSQSAPNASTHRVTASFHRVSETATEGGRDSYSSQGRPSSGGGDGDEELSVSDLGSVASVSSTGSMSRALVQVLDQHKAKVHAANPLLEPRHAHKGSMRPTSSHRMP